MPNGGAPLSPPHPTTVTVIGVGEAGCRMLNAVADAVKRIDPAPAFEYVVIDSRAADLERLAPERAETIRLDPPERSFEMDRSTRRYLSDDDTLPPSGGTARQRAVGRYHLDSETNFDDVYDTLSGVLDPDAADQSTESDEPVVDHVWVLSSLGGGTGAGLVPLLVTLLDECAPPDSWLFGLGSVDLLTGLGETIVPSADRRIAYNTYATLRELRALLGFEEDHYPIDLPVRAGADTIGTETITLTQSPLHAYGLLPMPPGAAADPDARAAVNRRVADLIVRSAQEPALLGSGPAQNGAFGATLFSADADGVEIPLDEITEYVDTRVETGATRERIDHHDAAAASLDAAYRAVDRLRNRSPDGSIDELFVPQRAADVAGTRAEELSRPEADLTLDSAVAEVRDAFGEFPHVDLAHDADVNPDPDAIATLLVAQETRARLEAALAEHPFPDRIDRLARELVDDDALREDADPIDLWDRTLAPLLRQRQSLLDRTVDELLPIRVRRRQIIESQREQAATRRSELATLRDEYARLRRVHDEAADELRDVETALRGTLEALDERRREVRETLDSLRAQRQNLEQRHEALRKNLTWTDGPYRHLPIENPDRLDPDLLAQTESISDLIDAGVLDQRAVAEGAHSMLDRLEEPVQDRTPHEIAVMPSSTLALSASGATFERMDDPDTCLGDAPPLSTTFDRFGSVSILDDRETRSVDAVVTFEGIQLENSSVFGPFDEYCAAPERSVGELFGADPADDDPVADSVAYPALFEAPGVTADTTD
ncbi:MAG: tubulin-like doman-containing protein [Halobellus sp.]|uniref:tubulin-like doman-containing protein n=1 Tax=Halobellus sp. TaxID=1979212 RepID=UPI0035D43369